MSSRLPVKFDNEAKPHARFCQPRNTHTELVGATPPGFQRFNTTNKVCFQAESEFAPAPSAPPQPGLDERPRARLRAPGHPQPWRGPSHEREGSPHGARGRAKRATRWRRSLVCYAFHHRTRLITDPSVSLPSLAELLQPEVGRRAGRREQPGAIRASSHRPHRSGPRACVRSWPRAHAVAARAPLSVHSILPVVGLAGCGQGPQTPAPSSPVRVRALDPQGIYSEHAKLVHAQQAM